MENASFNNTYDVVVIGAGMGGLTAAAVAAKAGLSVFSAEMNGAPGGCVSGFSRNGFQFETAVHWLNLFGPDGPARKLLSYLLPSVPETPRPQTIRRFKGETFDYTLTENPDALRDTLIRDFPRDEKGLVRFFDAARQMGVAFKRLTQMMQGPQTLALNERFRLFCATTAAGLPFMRYGGWSAERGLRHFFPSGGPGRMFCSEAALLSCLVPIGWIYTNNYHLAPKGGAATLARELSKTVGAYGGDIRLNTRAVRIVMERGRAVGVVFEDRDKKEFEVSCKYVIAACDTEYLYTQLLPESVVPRRLVRNIRRADLYDSAVTISLGLNRPARDFGVGEEMIYLTKDDLPRAEQDGGDPRDARITLLSSASADPSLAPPGKGTLTIYLPAKLSLYDGWHTAEGFSKTAAYRELKQQYADTVIKRIEHALMPGLRDSIEVCDVASPVTYLRYTGNRDGTIMGTRMSFKNLLRGVSGYQSPVRNVLIGGQWAEYSGGIPTAIRAGANAAMMILKRESPDAFEASREMFVWKV